MKNYRHYYFWASVSHSLASKRPSFSHTPLHLSVPSAFQFHLCCDTPPLVLCPILGATNALWMPLALSIAMFSSILEDGTFDKMIHKPAMSWLLLGPDGIKQSVRPCGPLRGAQATWRPGEQAGACHQLTPPPNQGKGAGIQQPRGRTKFGWVFIKLYKINNCIKTHRPSGNSLSSFSQQFGYGSFCQRHLWWKLS